MLRLTRLTMLLAMVFAVVGCVPKEDRSLRQGYDALAAQDFPRALSLADQQLRESPTGPGAAEAYYLRGRALEQMPTPSRAQSMANLAAARTAYEQALARNPSRTLRTYTRASLGNVAFFQDDYATAANAFSLAYTDLEDANSRAWALYRTGLSLQRLGRFEDADRTFAEVRRRYPDTTQARRAAEVAGARAFHLRIATYSTPGAAERATADLRRQGFRGIDTIRVASGSLVLRIGPYPTYTSARAAQAQLASRFPDAMIMP